MYFDKITGVYWHYKMLSGVVPVSVILRIMLVRSYIVVSNTLSITELHTVEYVFEVVFSEFHHTSSQINFSV